MKITGLNKQMSQSNCQNTKKKQTTFQPNFGIKFQASGDEILKVCPNWAEEVIEAVKCLNKKFDTEVQKVVKRQYDTAKKSAFFERAWKTIYKDTPIPKKTTRAQITKIVIPGFDETRIPITLKKREEKYVGASALGKNFSIGEYGFFHSCDQLSKAITEGYENHIYPIINDSKFSKFKSEINRLERSAEKQKSKQFLNSLKGQIIE